MKVIIDNKIPYIREAMEQLGAEAVYLPGREFTPEAVADADALIVRTRTRCDRQLLQGSRVHFIATATIGFDHIDTDYCHRAGITWTNAPGCNAASVTQYVESALLLLQQQRGVQLEGRTLGIVGVGNVGSRVERMARGLGLKVLCCDPPRARREGSEGFHPLTELARSCDLITFHVPLLRQGEDRTFHLADGAFFRSLQRRPVFINTSRGEVAETAALLRALEKGQVSDAVIDVWEGEPDIDRRLLCRAFLATPHIAGYSADGKANATRMSVEALCRFFGLPCPCQILPPAPADPVIHAATRTDALLQIYNPMHDSDALKAHPEAFEQLRGNYPLRREAVAYTIS